MRILERFDRPAPRANAFRQRGAGGLADSVDSEDGCAIEARREIRRSGVREIVGGEMQSPSQRTSKNLFDGAAYLIKPQPKGVLKPLVPPLGAKSRPAQIRIERVRDMIDIVSVEPGVFQAKADRMLRELMRIIECSRLAVLDAI